MTPWEKQTLDDMVFENRNKEYGSYQLRKRYFRRLAIGFSVSLAFILFIVFGAFFYLNKSGDETIYFGSSEFYSRETNVSLISLEELKAYSQSNKLPEAPENNQQIKQADPLRNFIVTENPVTDTFAPPGEDNNEDDETNSSGYGMINDSTVFGGSMDGNGEGLTGVVERIPVFSAGNLTEYVEKNVRYPAAAMKKKIHGIVRISFVVTKNGSVRDVQVIRSVDPLIDAEVVKVLKNMPSWKPALRQGKPVNFLIVIPVNFIPIS